MKCVKAQGLITKYINNELHGELVEDFLKHMDECRDCKEDLEIYYVIMKGMQQIDEDNVLDYNFHRAFEHDLMDSKARLVKSNKRFIVKFFVFEIMVILIAFLLSSDVAEVDNSFSSKIETFNGIVID